MCIFLTALVILVRAMVTVHPAMEREQNACWAIGLVLFVMEQEFAKPAVEQKLHVNVMQVMLLVNQRVRATCAMAQADSVKRVPIIIPSFPQQKQIWTSFLEATQRKEHVIHASEQVFVQPVQEPECAATIIVLWARSLALDAMVLVNVVPAMAWVNL